MKITWVNSLYGMLTWRIVTGDISFENNSVVFTAEGHEYSVPTKYVVKIELAAE